MQCPTPLSISDPNTNSNADRISVPCGKCGACLANRRADWSFRLKQELKAASSAFFITLTYADENLQFSEDGLPTLNKKHWQLYIKRVRKAVSKQSENKLRYYTVGEYGTKTSRPHYHSLIFNVPPGMVNTLRERWDYGLVDIGTVEPASIHYVTKYHVNKNEENHEYVDQETGEVYTREPEFCTMSRRPGIGYNYIEKVKGWHLDDERNYVINNGFKQRIPRYYRDKIFDPITRKAMSIRYQPELIKSYNDEVERLRKLKISEPEHYIFKSQIAEAKKVQKKANQTDTF